MTSTASTIGTLVKSEETSKLTRISFLSILISLIVSKECLVFKTWDSVFPASGEIVKATCLERTYAGDNGSEGDCWLLNLWQT